jgi:hypothetical protein
MLSTLTRLTQVSNKLPTGKAKLASTPTLLSGVMNVSSNLKTWHLKFVSFFHELKKFNEIFEPSVYPFNMGGGGGCILVSKFVRISTPRCLKQLLLQNTASYSNTSISLIPKKLYMCHPVVFY